MNVEKIIDVIDAGGLVISPTDTVYGIMSSIDNDSVKKVFESKNRNVNKPLILLMDSIEMIKDYTSNISEIEEKLINKFMPGLVTIILKKNNKVSDLITCGMDTVGVRIPDNKDLLEIIKKHGRPVVSTSANITGSEVITSIDMIDDDLRRNVDYIEDGGKIISSSSTIVRFDDNKLKILREGLLANEIKEFFGER